MQINTFKGDTMDGDKDADETSQGQADIKESCLLLRRGSRSPVSQRPVKKKRKTAPSQSLSPECWIIQKVSPEDTMWTLLSGEQTNEKMVGAQDRWPIGRTGHWHKRPIVAKRQTGKRNLFQFHWQNWIVEKTRT